jgi:hypothetical protein
LTIALSGGNTLISWPANTPSAYMLINTTNLVLGPWVAVTNSVVLSNGVYQVTVPATPQPAIFYRLKL